MLWPRAPSEDSDQPAHSRRLIRIFTGRICDSQGCKVSLPGRRRLRSECLDEQDDLCLRWMQMAEGTFYPDATHIYKQNNHRVSTIIHLQTQQREKKSLLVTEIRTCLRTSTNRKLLLIHVIKKYIDVACDWQRFNPILRICTYFCFLCSKWLGFKAHANRKYTNQSPHSGLFFFFFLFFILVWMSVDILCWGKMEKKKKKKKKKKELHGYVGLCRDRYLVWLGFL